MNVIHGRSTEQRLGLFPLVCSPEGESPLHQSGVPESSHSVAENGTSDI